MVIQTIVDFEVLWPTDRYSIEYRYRMWYCNAQLASIIGVYLLRVRLVEIILSTSLCVNIEILVI